MTDIQVFDFGGRKVRTADFTSEAVRRVVTSGCDFAKISTNWQDWKFKMELVFGAKALQMPIMVPVLTERRTEENVGQLS